MLQDVVHPPEQLSIDEISSPLGAQIFEFCDPELFPETLQNSEVGSSSTCCYEENSSYSFAQEISKFTSIIDANTAPNTTNTATSNINTINNNNNTNANANNLSIIFDSTEEIDNDISASIDFSPSPAYSVPQFLTAPQDQFGGLSSLPSHIPGTGVVVDGLSQYPPDSVVPMVGQLLPAVYEDECLCSMPSYMRMNPSSPSCSFFDHTMGPYMQQANLNATMSAQNSGIFSGDMLMAAELQPQELDYLGDKGGIFCPEPLPRIFNSTGLQALSNESQHLVSGSGSGSGGSAPLASEISSLEDSTCKVGKLSVEERKEKIHRYMKKRNERNFSKKIKYACRKTLADSRPRVRGRFAKNDEFGETHRTNCGHHEEDTDEDVVVKEEDDITSDIFAHISGVNSFKCNYPIQSWI